MYPLGKIHEISFYGVLATILGLILGKVSLAEMWEAKLHIINFPTLFLSYLFWACVLFVPIAIIGAFATKYGDDGHGLSFKSNNILVIVFAHIAEELLGLVCSPFWFLVDLFRKRLDDEGKAIDYITYVIELVFIAIGMVSL